MAGAQRSGARWFALLLGVALVASAAVAYALIRVTTPGPGGEQAVASSQGTVAASVPVSPADVTVSTPATAPSSASPTALPSAGPASPAPSDAPATSTSPAGATASGAGTQAGSTPSPSADAVPETDAVTTQSSTLGGSGVTIPAEWSGVATITVRVLGDCSTRTPSVYTNAPADVALDLTQNEGAAVSPTTAVRTPDNQPALTLGVNTSAVPAVAVYSSTVDDTGAFHRYWRITLSPEADRTRVQGTLLEQAVAGPVLNTLTDAETSLQPCADPGTVGLPRALAAGSTIDGWVSRTRASLTLHATTTDHKRAVTVQISAVRKK